MTAIWAAREVKKIKRVVASKNSHNSVKKAADILGENAARSEATVTVHKENTDCTLRLLTLGPRFALYAAIVFGLHSLGTR